MLQFEKERRQHGHLSQMHQVVEKYLLFAYFVTLEKMSVGVVALKLFLVELLRVDFAPAVDDVGQDEGHEEGHVEHGAQRELAGARVLERE